MSAKTIEFAQIADIHMSKSSSSNYNNTLIDSRYTSISSENLKLAIDSINRNKKIKFVVFLGDNIDKPDKKVFLEFLKIISRLNVPYYIAFGNHDSYKFSDFTQQEFIEYSNKYNCHQYSKNGYFEFNIAHNLKGVVLNGNMPYLFSSHGYFDEKQLKWLKSRFEKNRNCKFLIFQHFPLIEPNVNKSQTVNNKKPYLNLLKTNKSQILSISSGHYHQSNICIDENNILHISSPAFQKKPYIYNIIKLTKSKKEGSHNGYIIEVKSEQID